MGAPNPTNRRPWNTNDAGLNAIFCAALTGFIANRYFHDAAFQGSPEAAVEFADSVVLSALQSEASA